MNYGTYPLAGNGIDLAILNPDVPQAKRCPDISDAVDIPAIAITSYLNFFLESDSSLSQCSRNFKLFLFFSPFHLCHRLLFSFLFPHLWVYHIVHDLIYYFIQAIPY